MASSSSRLRAASLTRANGPRLNRVLESEPRCRMAIRTDATKNGFRPASSVSSAWCPSRSSARRSGLGFGAGCIGFLLVELGGGHRPGLDERRQLHDGGDGGGVGEHAAAQPPLGDDQGDGLADRARLRVGDGPQLDGAIAALAGRQAPAQRQAGDVKAAAQQRRDVLGSGRAIDRLFLELGTLLVDVAGLELRLRRRLRLADVLDRDRVAVDHARRSQGSRRRARGGSAGGTAGAGGDAPG